MKRLIKNYFLVNLFVSLLFLFSNVQKIPLWLSSIMQQFDIFWKLLENLQGKVCDEDHICKDIKTTYQLNKWLCSSEATEVDVYFSRKGIHTQIHYINDLIEPYGLLLNRLVKAPQIIEAYWGANLYKHISRLTNIIKYKWKNYID